MKINNYTEENLKLNVENQDGSDRNQVAMLINDLVEAISLENSQNFDTDFSSILQKISQRNDKMEKKVGGVFGRNSCNVVDRKLSQQSSRHSEVNLSFEDRETSYQKILGEISQRNTAIENKLGMKHIQNQSYRANDTPPSDRNSEINKKMYQQTLLRGFGTGCMTAIIAAFFFGLLGVLVVFFVAGTAGAIGGFLFLKCDQHN